MEKTKRLAQIASLPRFGTLSLIPNDLADKVTLFCVIKSDSGPIATFVVDNLDVYHIKEKKVEKLCSFSGTEISVEQIAASSNVVLILGSDKRVYLLDSNRNRQLGNDEIRDAGIGALSQLPMGEEKYEVTQIASGYHSTCLSSNGRIKIWPIPSASNQQQPSEMELFEGVETPTEIVQMAVCYNAVFALDVEGRLWCWGFQESSIISQSGHIADYEYLTQVDTGILKQEKICHIQIDCTGNHLYALTCDGKLIIWAPEKVFGSVPIDEPTVVSFGYSQEPKIVSLAIEPVHNSLLVAETEDGQLFAWGHLRNLYNQDEVEVSKRRRLDGWNEDILSMTPIKIPEKFYNPWNALFKLTTTEEPYTCDFIKVVRKIREPIGLHWAYANAFDDRTTSDFQVIVENRAIHVHKAILSIRCGHFRRMFANTECKEVRENKLVISEPSYQVYKAFLRLLYTDVLSSDDAHELSVEEVFEIFDLAGSYLEDSLQHHIFNFLLNVDNKPENVLAKYKCALERLALFSENHFLARIRDKSFRAINASLGKVVESSLFESEYFDAKMARSFIKQLAQSKINSQP